MKIILKPLGVLTLMAMLVSLSGAAVWKAVGAQHPGAVAGQSASTSADASKSLSIYNGGLQSGWTDLTWATDHDIANRSEARPGGAGTCIRIHGKNFEGFSTRHEGFSSAGYDRLCFRASGGAEGGQHLQVSGMLSDKTQGQILVGPLSAHKWETIVVDLSTLKVKDKNDLTGFMIQIYSKEQAPDFYLDDIQLLAPGQSVPQ